MAARAAEGQRKVTGGEVVAHADRVVVTQEQFYPMLVSDLASASSRVVIYSAFMTEGRLGQLEPQLKATIERGVNVYVVTKARSDRNKRELANYRRLEQALEDWGVILIHKRRMHEKLVFIDDDILWAGSLNPLSFSDTQEIMERRHNKKIVADYASTVLLEDLVGEFRDGPPSCPICDSEIVASEGKDDPFYWRCVEDGCYSRSVDQLPPADGVISCSNCGKPVKFGRWGGKPVWRCKVNKQHRQKIARTHLRLPKMRAIVPKWELKELEQLFGIELIEKKPNPPKRRRGKLFD